MQFSLGLRIESSLHSNAVYNKKKAGKWQVSDDTFWAEFALKHFFSFEVSSVTCCFDPNITASIKSVSSFQNQDQTNCRILIPWRRDILERPSNAQLAKNPCPFRKCIAVFARVYHWSLSWANWIRLISSRPSSLRLITIISFLGGRTPFKFSE
jgi:hypothetical protein